MACDRRSSSALSGGIREKNVISVADLMCDVTRHRGITEIQMTDHSMATMMKARTSKHD